MKTNLTNTLQEIYEKHGEISPTSPIWNKLLEAKDTIEHHEKEMQTERDRFEALSLQYMYLYQNRKQLIQDFRIGIILSILTTATLMAWGYYFL